MPISCTKHIHSLRRFVDSLEMIVRAIFSPYGNNYSTLSKGWYFAQNANSCQKGLLDLKTCYHSHLLSKHRFLHLRTLVFSISNDLISGALVAYISASKRNPWSIFKVFYIVTIFFFFVGSGIRFVWHGGLIMWYMILSTYWLSRKTVFLYENS